MASTQDGPIIIVDDDSDDREFLNEAWEELNFSNNLLFLDNAEALIHYLRSGQPTPFLILCDVNLPKMNGFELKAQLLKETSVNYKSIPFVFWSNSVTSVQVEKAYDLGGNGFFVKEGSLQKIKESMFEIVTYWKKCKTPYNL